MGISSPPPLSLQIQQHPTPLPTRTVQGITWTHFRVDLLEGRVILIYLEVDFCCGDGESPLGHHHGSDELGRRAENHWACKIARTAVRLSECLRPSPAPSPKGTRALVCKDALKDGCLHYAIMRRVPFMWDKVCLAFTLYLTTDT